MPKLYATITCIQCYNMDRTVNVEFHQPEKFKGTKKYECARCGHEVVHDFKLFK
jgi:hypothetical protein